MTVLVIVLVIFLVLLTGMLLAFLFSRMAQTVTTTREGMAAEERAYNPGVTLGHRIKVESDYEEQLKQARQVAAKKAAATPRGKNVRIGRNGKSTLVTAGKNAKNDPLTAVRIARFHGWDGARTGIPAGVAAAAAAVAAPGVARPAAAAGIAPPNLIAITDAMSPDEVRKARIANAKAEAAYNKALKAGAPAAVAGPAPAAPPIAAAAAAPVAIGIEPPKLIEITPGMPPDEVRKARIANAKAEAAYNKALKAAGATTARPAAAVPSPAAPEAAPVAAPAVAPVAVGIAPPTLIEITPGMPPDEVRRARVANAKAEAAYNKALKAAGIDPSAVKGGAAVAAPTPAAVAEATASAEAPPAPTPSPVAPAAPAVPAGIQPPQLIEITAAMSPEDIRRARVENAKATAAYNKALKAAGIDPASLK
jgi:hypothetical protein